MAGSTACTGAARLPGVVIGDRRTARTGKVGPRNEDRRAARMAASESSPASSAYSAATELTAQSKKKWLKCRVATAAASAHRCNDEGKKDDQRDDKHSIGRGSASALRDVGPVRRREALFCRENSAEERQTAKQSMEIESAPMTAELNEAKAGENFARSFDSKC